jgi:hypothetical protein
MPSIRKRAWSRRPDPATPAIRELLASGHWFQFTAGRGETEPTEAELRKLWAEVREDFLAKHTARSPGTRPWAWWKFEATEPRLQVAPGPEALGPADWFGMPSKYAGMPPDDMYETEAEYLERLGLLTDEERDRLR